MISASVNTIVEKSDKIIIFFRFHRSISGPMNGPRNAMGITFIIIAMERMVAEPVSLARYQASANPTMELPIWDAAWLDQRTKNFFNLITFSKHTVMRHK